MAKHTKPQFTPEHVAAFFEKLREIRDIELLILKAHAGFEQLLFTAVACRLNVSTSDLSPRLQFKMLVDLALVGSGQTRFISLLERFTSVRNAFAHAMDPDPETTARALEEFIDLTHAWAAEECANHASLRQARKVGWIIDTPGEPNDLAIARRIRGGIGILFSHLMQTCREMVYLSRDTDVPTLPGREPEW
ncbi:MAG: hypothetical protein QOC81_4076 [Thermoanaerobaculia bacterium]|jgi:hypothetical protein|nr:hypothetical protein [Thermoanaerobaculia bacterium]